MKNDKYSQRERVTKISEKNTDEAFKLIYQWVKEDDISLKEFKELTKHLNEK